MTTDLRRKENLHIVFWLVKDFAWLMEFRVLGMSMALPTFLLSCWLTWKSRENRSELFHNVAVTCWICGNIIWMSGEFFCKDCLRPYAQPAFFLGLMVIAWFYTTEWLNKKKAPEGT